MVKYIKRIVKGKLVIAVKSVPVNSTSHDEVDKIKQPDTLHIL